MAKCNATRKSINPYAYRSIRYYDGSQVFAILKSIISYTSCKIPKAGYGSQVCAIFKSSSFYFLHIGREYNSM